MLFEIRWGISNLILSQQGLEFLILPLLGNMDDQDGGDEEEEEEDDETGDAKSGEDGEKKSLKEKMQAMQEIALQIQVKKIQTK